jgi:hypothetical protein
MRLQRIGNGKTFTLLAVALICLASLNDVLTAQTANKMDALKKLSLDQLLNVE